MNLDADQRARAAGFPNAGDQDKAYLLGFSIGTLKKKHDWEARVYWQRTGQYALDPNLVDSDWFDARVNMQGWFLGAGYNITDAVFTAARYGWAKRNDSALGHRRGGRPGAQPVGQLPAPATRSGLEVLSLGDCRPPARRAGGRRLRPVRAAAQRPFDADCS